jgi:hypothetical protein
MIFSTFYRLKCFFLRLFLKPQKASQFGKGTNKM